MPQLTDPENFKWPLGKAGKHLCLAGKLLVTAGLCALILAHTEWGSLGTTLRQVNLLMALAVFLLMLLSVAISAYKWQLLLSIHGAHVEFNRLHRYYYVAALLNNFFPSSIGGDGYRIYKTLDNSRSKMSAVVAVLVERISGILALVILGYLAAVVIYFRSGDRLAQAVAAAGTIGAAATLVVLVATIKAKAVRRFAAGRTWPPRIRALAGHLGDFARQPGKASRAAIISFLFHVHTVLFYWLLIYALGESIGVLELTVILAVTTTLGVLPITLNGIGLIDGSFIYLATHYGINYESALSAMLMIRGATVLISLVGAYFHCAGQSKCSSKVSASVKGASS